MSTKTMPQLPVELVAEIISTAWHMPLSQNERITFMRSSTLVNSTWADVFNLVSSRDVYITSSAFCDHFVQHLRQRPAPHTSPSSSLWGLFLRPFRGPTKQPVQPRRSANLACQSLTIQAANEDRVHPGKISPMRLPMAGVLDMLLETLDAWTLAPNLRRLSIEYFDTGFEDIFSRVGLAALPPQITHLDVRYSFSERMPVWLVESLKRKQERRRHLMWKAPAITRLSIVGAGENTVRDLLAVCPNVHTLTKECKT
ncbi:hypothetical protein C8R45DRAFT_1013459 [Mycena sanguinolenta]|nr:hypothetical protein C8R45DRAFT_1013459 [Mycena sanguinolenta]